MYSPYTYPGEELTRSWSGDNYVMPGRITAGALAGVGMLGLGVAGGISTRVIHNRLMNKQKRYYELNLKLSNPKEYERLWRLKNPGKEFGTNYAHDFYKMATNPLYSFGKQLKLWETREAFPLEQKIYNKLGIKAGRFNGKFVSMPILTTGIFAMMNINEQFEKVGDSRAIGRGVVQTGAELAGGFVGQGVGALIGLAVGGPIGAMAFGLAGSALGALAGSQSMNVYDALKIAGRKWTNPELGGGIIDNAATQTMRARSLNAIRTSQFNIRSAIGNEAFYMNTGLM